MDFFAAGGEGRGMRAGFVVALVMVTACPGDKGGSTGTTTEAGSTGGTTGTTAGTTTEATGSSGSSGLTGGVTGKCEELADQASCEAVSAEDFSCEWVDVQEVAVDMCVVGGTAKRCVEVSFNDGGCSPCFYKDLGGGQFEGVVLDPQHVGCQSNAEFSSCTFFDGPDAPICACLCPDLVP